MNSTEVALKPSAAIQDHWRDLVARYQTPSVSRSLWQVANTVPPYLLLLGAMYWSLGVSYWLTLALSVPAAGFLVRIFVISHDCGHGSFFKKAWANTLVGSFTSYLCWSPYHYWKHDHALHHASTGNLDRRGHGDIWTMTVQEYEAAPRRTRLAYRLYRNPLILFGIGSFYVFVLDYRMPPRDGNEKNRRSVWRMNIALLATLVVAYFTIGIKAYVLVQAPIFFLSAAAGAWLFYVQHQFEGVYWARKGEWDYVAGAMEGSSYYHLPRVLQWFSGNIGFHHIHHLSSKIPNYHLEACHKAHPAFRDVPRLTLWSSLACLRYRLYDESTGRLLSFREFHRLRRD